ncbi:MAG: CBS domain-containing protein [Proteobacteria bacterium]|nr:CBS domain-containing protein [Desulfobacteraceae bacterium]MBU2522481.1 CBS domain-containing protein [Pseudomonadota bacterium]MBU3980384.1 CBS domain-containing protein [Pseudomonadota bacterium]MBU4014033.1 CBS domain-containing protein [Pseudomonadota bacterium]MBU4066862.1 CBS domain-containing protein [Pseudomonadota bacterium]
MKINSLMIPNPITITEKASVSEAIELMKINSIRHLPVVSEKNLLAGLVTLADLKQGLIPSMVAGVTLSDLIIKNPITVGPDDDIEIAAKLIYKHKIGGMPVVKKGKVVGIITGTDILRTFIEMMGMLTASSRIDVVIGEEPGAFKQALHIINDNGGDIISVGMTAQPASKRIYYFRLFACKTDIIKKALKKEGFEVIAAMAMD